MADTASQIAKAQIDAERNRLAQRQKQLAIVEKMVESWTEEQVEAIMALSSLCQAAAQQRLMALRAQNPVTQMGPPSMM